MAIKRKILTFADFKKGKNSLENPAKHPIKESLDEELTDDAKDFIQKKIKKLIGEGMPQKQAVAVAYSYARKEGYEVPKNESLSEKEMKDMDSAELVKGNVYKVFDKENNGALVYSAAKFDSTDSKGNKFALINRPTESFVWIKKEDMKKFIFTPSSYKKKA